MQELPPISNEFTHAIASRVFELVCPTETVTLTLEIGAPVQDVTCLHSVDWRCPVRLSHGAHADVVSICGIDSFQALQMAIRTVSERLEAVAAQYRATLHFLEGPYDFATHLPLHPSSPRHGHAPLPAGRGDEPEA